MHENKKEWDFFICHASEDKEEVVRPLVMALIREGFTAWYDEFALTIGDRLRRSIDRGLAQSKYGLVILSASFFAKNWPQTELDGLAARESNGRKVILPIWHDVDQNYVKKFSPSLADRFAISTSEGIDAIVKEILRVVKPRKTKAGTRLSEERLTPEQRIKINQLGRQIRRIVVSEATERNLAFALTEVSRITIKLGLLEKTLRIASIICRGAAKERLMQSVLKRGTGAAAVNMASVLTGENMSLRKIAEIVEISEDVIGRRKSELLEKLLLIIRV